MKEQRFEKVVGGKEMILTDWKDPITWIVILMGLAALTWLVWSIAK